MTTLYPPQHKKRPPVIQALIACLRASLGIVVAFQLPIFSAQAEEATKYFVLDNGLKVFLYERHNIPLLNVVTAFNVGSKDETEETSGLVHLLEHYILFRGTEFRSGAQVGRDIRSHGAYFNAHTGQDIALFEISLPSEHAAFALANQKEILFNLQFTQEGLDAEKEVVLEEMNQMDDDPVKFGMNLMFQTLFKGHPYGRSIYGDRNNIKAATTDRMTQFYSRYFVPANGALALVGDFRLTEMEAMVRSVFGPIPKVDFAPAGFENVGLVEKSLEIQETKDVNKAYLLIGLVAPDLASPDQFAADVLTEMLGRGVNPMLNSVLRGQRELIQTLSMVYFSFRYGGAFLITISLDPKNVRSAAREAVGFLRRVREQNFSKNDVIGENQLYAFDFLLSAKNQINHASQESQENGLGVAASLAKYLLLSDGTKQGNYLESIDRLDSSAIRKAAAKYLNKGDYVTISIVPKEGGK